MRIGLDLDNTLVCYDDVFVKEAVGLGLVPKGWHGDKRQVKKMLSKLSDGERKWQILQGKAYGPGMDQAKLFPGVAWFLMRCKARDDDVYIVSHKTEFGHFDSTRTSLREAAISWMIKNRFFDPLFYSVDKDNVFFLPTRAEKIKKIGRLHLDVFVDDLEEVLLEESFPKIKKILFGSSSSTDESVLSQDSWIDIGSSLFGEITERETWEILQSVCDEKIASVSRASKSRNSRVFRVTTECGNKYAAKLYPDLTRDPRPRLEREFAAYRLLEHLDFTPKFFWSQRELNIGFFEWIEGREPNSSSPTAIQSALEFTMALKVLHDRSDKKFPTATEACLSIEDLSAQIESRLVTLESVENTELQELLRQKIRPLWKEIGIKQRQTLSEDSTKERLSIEKQTLSPSDFGFHNAVEREDGKILFYDLEYFGRDDPVKLIADFLWHPGMCLSRLDKDRWINGAFRIFADDPKIELRLKVTWAYYGMRWALIMLNSFRTPQSRDSGQEDWSKTTAELQISQLKKVNGVCNFLQETSLECPYV